MIRNPLKLYIEDKNPVTEAELARVTEIISKKLNNTNLSDILIDSNNEIGYCVDLYFLYDCFRLYILNPYVDFQDLQNVLNYDDLFIFNTNIENRTVDINLNYMELLNENTKLAQYMEEYNLYLSSVNINGSIGGDTDIPIATESSFTYKQLFVMGVFGIFILRSLYNYLYDKYYTASKNNDTIDEDSLSSFYEEFFVDIEYIILLIIPYSVILSINLIRYKLKNIRRKR